MQTRVLLSNFIYDTEEHTESVQTHDNVSDFTYDTEDYISMKS